MNSTKCLRFIRFACSYCFAQTSRASDFYSLPRKIKAVAALLELLLLRRFQVATVTLPTAVEAGAVLDIGPELVGLRLETAGFTVKATPELSCLYR